MADRPVADYSIGPSEGDHDAAPAVDAIRVLVVEDNRGDVRLLQEALGEVKNFNVRLEREATLARGIERVAEQRDFDVVLLDLGLPDSRGVKTLERFLSVVQDVPVILLTGLGDESTAIQAMRAGAQDYLVKDHVNGEILSRSIRYSIERHKNEEKLRTILETLQERTRELTAQTEASRRLAAIIESSDDAIIGQTLNGIITSWNKGAERIYGYTETEVLGRPITMLTPEGAQDGPPEMLRRIRRGARVDHYETKRIRKDGGICEVSVTVSPIRDADGKIVGASSVSRDVTAKRRSQRRFQTLLESAPDAMLIVDRAGRIQIANKQAQKMFGFNREELTRLTVEDLQPARYRDNHAKHRAEYAKNPHPRPMGVGLDLWGLRKDGTVFPVEISLSPIEDDGERSLVIAAIRDISDRKKAEHALEEARTQVAISEKLAVLGTLVSGVGHEIKTPLTLIQNNVFLLRRKASKTASAHPGRAEDAEAFLRYANAIEQGVDRINDLVKGVRRLVQAAPLEKTSATLTEVAEAGADLIQATHRGKVTLERGFQSKRVLHLNPGEMQQVVLNLLSNAWEAMPHGGRLRVTTRDVPGGAELEVTDEGTGIPPEVQAHLFEPFHTSNAPRHTGLGLSIVRRIIDGHGGQIRYETEMGKGTTFTIFVPGPK